MAGKPSQFNNWPNSLPVTYGPYKAIIDRVVDADTVYAFISLGMDQYTYEAIRLWGVNAPEIFSGTAEQRARGFAAKDYLESIAPVGTPCVIRTDKDRQSFGRYSASILLQDGTDVASALVSAGHAEFSDW